MALVLFSKSIYFVFFLKRITTPGRIFHDRWSRHTSPLLSVWLRVPGENLNKKMFKKMRASSQVSERAGGESRVADTGSLSSPAHILCYSILTSTFYHCRVILESVWSEITIHPTPPDRTTKFRSDCWNPLQTELNYLWWVLSCSQDDIRWF